MRVRLVAIPVDDLPSVRTLVDALRKAVNTGDMDGMDVATAKLMALEEGRQAVDLSEKDWHASMADIRSGSRVFQSDYLLPGETCSAQFPHLAPGTMVLNLPIDAEGEVDVC